MRATLTRLRSNDKQTIGKLFIPIYHPCFTANFNTDFYCKTIELPDRDNQRYISRIPARVYECKKRWSWKFGRHIQVLDVPNRTWILVHRGNYFFNSTGCIIIGDSLSDINNDGYQDVLNSKRTLKRMLNILPERFTLEIIDNED